MVRSQTGGLTLTPHPPLCNPSVTPAQVRGTRSCAVGGWGAHHRPPLLGHPSITPLYNSPFYRYEAQGHVRWVAGAHTTGSASRSFTSSCMGATTKNERQMTRFDRNPSKKGYVRMHTNLGEGLGGA